MNQAAPKYGERRGYRIRDAAEYMGVSPWFVESKIRSGELPALRLCRHYTVLREDLDAFLDRKRKEIPGPRAEHGSLHTAAQEAANEAA